MISLIIASILGAILYRMGGSSNYNTKYRDLGLPTLMVLLFTIWGLFNWTLLLCFGLMFGALTTYFKKTGSDAKWWNWLLVGLALGLSMFPFALTGHLLGFYIRTVLLIILITLWSELNSNAVWEEMGRGFLIIATLGLLRG